MHSAETVLSITNEFVFQDFCYFKNRLGVVKKKLETALGNEALLQSSFQLLKELITVSNRMLSR